jgi:hypothetical protein
MPWSYVPAYLILTASTHARPSPPTTVGLDLDAGAGRRERMVGGPPLHVTTSANAARSRPRYRAGIDLEGIAKASAAVVAPVGTLIGVGSRRRRLRNEIRENLALVKAIEQDDILREHTPAAGWLQGKITVDVAKLAGRSLGTPLKPIPWGSVVFAAIWFAALAAWTLYVSRDGFVWYSVFPGLGAFLMIVSIVGMTTNRQLPPEQTGDLPPGATPIRTDSANERVATSVELAAAGAVDAMSYPMEQVRVAFRFFEAMSEGRYDDGLREADELWVLCRIQSWLWNNRNHFGDDLEELQSLAESLLRDREPTDVWSTFVSIETAMFVGSWGSHDPSKYGAASHRRRLSREYDLVVLAPVGHNGGYFVMTATAIPNAMSFVVHRHNDRWRVANHLGMAPPQPGWPPIWWAINDAAVVALPES